MTQRLAKTLFLMCGCLSLALGVIGIFLPLLPTTPFILLAAFCFARSSNAFHAWLISHRRFGPIILNWERHGAISRPVKFRATITIALLVPLSLWMISPHTWIVLGVALTITAVLLYIWTRPEGQNSVGESG